MTFRAPVDDVQFAMEVAGLERVCELRGDDFAPDLAAAIMDEAAKIANDVLAPLNRAGDEVGAKWSEEGVTTVPGWQDAYRQFAEGGWCSTTTAEAYGGQALPMLIASAVQEQWEASNMGFALCPMLTRGAIEAIEHHGSDALKETYLPNMAAGVWTGTMNLTEPQAGSDLAAVRTKAVPEGDHYRISGQKIFITYGEHDLTDNIIHLVLARLPDAPAGVKGISLFVVPKFLLNEDGSCGERNDVKCVSIEHKLGIHASPTCVMSFGDNDGAIGYLVGEENQGLMYMFTMMNLARHAVGVQGYAIAEGAYQKALEYARDRVQGPPMLAGENGSRSIVNHPDVRRQLMTMKAGVQAMRMLAYEGAVAFDVAKFSQDPEEKKQAQRRGEFLTPLIKGWSTEEGVNLCSLGVQVHGGMGFIEETGAAQYYRDSRITPIYEGTTAIQANDLIGRKMQRDGGQGAGEWIADMRATVAALEASSADWSDAMAKSLSASVDAAERVVAWVLDSDQPALPAAASANILMMFGALGGGWMSARAALQAAANAELADADQAKLESRIQLAQFYIATYLPSVAAAADTVTQASGLVVALDEAQL